MSGSSHRNFSFSSMVNTALVSTGTGVIKQCSTKDQAKYNKFNIATGQNSCSSLSRKTDAAHNKIQHYGGLNVGDTTNSILVASLSESTRKKYNPYQQKWHIYCQENNINPVTPNITNVLDFLSNLYDQGLSYSAINSAKSALSHIILIPPYTKLSDHPLISQYGKGVFNLKPPRPKLQFVWDVKIVFSYLEEKGLNNILPDKILSQKLLILLLLLGGQRMNTVFNFEVDNMFINTECAIFSPNKVLKHSKPGRKLDQFTYRSFPQKELCVVDTLQEYLTQRKLRVDYNIKKLFITLKAPYHEASIDTLRRWIYDLFSGSQLLKKFLLHSCRAAVTSKAKKLNDNMEDNLKQGC